MIDCYVKFGSFLPKVPEVYKNEALNNNNSDVENELRKASDCFIGPHWTSLKLIGIEKHNHDTSIFEFELPDPNAHLKLPVTAHLLVKTGGESKDADMDVGGEEKEQQESHHVRPYTAVEEKHAGRFKIMVKLYKAWGTPESELKQQKYFSYIKTDHSYKPPGKVSNYIHSLRIGQFLSFKHSDICLGKVKYPFDETITAITMIAVGAGVAPMIRILRTLLDGEPGNNKCLHVKKIRLLYGARTVADILQRKQLDQWHDDHSGRFQVCYCVGSRWANVHFHAKTDNAEGPPSPVGWESVPEDRKVLGWVDGDKVLKRGASTADDEGHRILICGLPGVYLALCGPRGEPLHEGTQLHKLGYRDHQVVKF